MPHHHSNEYCTNYKINQMTNSSQSQHSHLKFMCNDTEILLMCFHSISNIQCHSSCGGQSPYNNPRERILACWTKQAARVVSKKYKNVLNSVTELMWGLHWLSIRACIQYKILTAPCLQSVH